MIENTGNRFKYVAALARQQLIYDRNLNKLLLFANIGLYNVRRMF